MTAEQETHKLRIWVDMTAPAHPLVLRPIIERLQARGHDVQVTARDYAQTLELLRRLGIEHVAFGSHAGASRVRKVSALASRTQQAIRWARGRGFDLAVAHGSNDLALAAAALRIPALNTFDYEWATQQHNVGCRLARRVMVPQAIPPSRLTRYGVTSQKLVQYPGLKEEYYLYDFEPDPAVIDELGLDRERITVIVRPPPEVSLYHRKANRLFQYVLADLGLRPDVQAIVIPRTTTQREYVRSLELPSVVLAEHAVDAQSLIAFADLVVSAGGTMNREAVALGVPVYTTFGGRLGGVDEDLIRTGRLRPLTDPRAIELRKRDGPGARVRRDPDLLVDLVLGTLDVGQDRGTPTAMVDTTLASTPSGQQATPDPRPGQRPAPAERGPVVVPPSPPSPWEESLLERYEALQPEGTGLDHRPADKSLRRLDLAISGTALLVLWPVIAGVSGLIVLTSGRPVFYHGRRVGRGGRDFTMLKFRTLQPDAESRLGPYSGRILTELTKAERTPVGQVLRATYLDEVPQFVNVVKGEMSIVGPRPIRPAFFSELCEDIPQYWQRLVVPPGMTGPAQLRMTRNMSWAEKLSHDLEYIADRSVRFYLWIIAQTGWKVLKGLVGRSSASDDTASGGR